MRLADQLLLTAGELLHVTRSTATAVGSRAGSALLRPLDDAHLAQRNTLLHLGETNLSTLLGALSNSVDSLHQLLRSATQLNVHIANSGLGPLAVAAKPLAQAAALKLARLLIQDGRHLLALGAASIILASAELSLQLAQKRLDATNHLAALRALHRRHNLGIVRGNLLLPLVAAPKGPAALELRLENSELLSALADSLLGRVRALLLHGSLLDLLHIAANLVDERSDLVLDGSATGFIRGALAALNLHAVASHLDAQSLELLANGLVCLLGDAELVVVDAALGRDRLGLVAQSLKGSHVRLLSRLESHGKLLVSRAHNASHATRAATAATTQTHHAHARLTGLALAQLDAETNAARSLGALGELALDLGRALLRILLASHTAALLAGLASGSALLAAARVRPAADHAQTTGRAALKDASNLAAQNLEAARTLGGLGALGAQATQAALLTLEAAALLVVAATLPAQSLTSLAARAALLAVLHLARAAGGHTLGEAEHAAASSGVHLLADGKASLDLNSLSENREKKRPSPKKTHLATLGSARLELLLDGRPVRLAR